MADGFKLGGEVLDGRFGGFFNGAGTVAEPLERFRSFKHLSSAVSDFMPLACRNGKSLRNPAINTQFFYPRRIAVKCGVRAVPSLTETSLQFFRKIKG